MPTPLSSYLPVVLAWRRPSRLLALAGIALLGAEAGADLQQRSPFLPSDFTPPAAEAPRPSRNTTSPLSQRVEFRGFYALNGEYRFLIKEKNQPAGRWVRLDEANGGFLVSEFDPSRKAVRLRLDGQEELLELVKVDSSSGPMPISGAPSMPEDAGGDRGPQAGPAQSGPSVAANESDRGANNRSVRRRTPPPPPQWLQERLAQRGVNTAGAMERLAEGPPDIQPPPPPNFVPPPPPSSAPSGGPPSDDQGRPTSAPPDLPGAPGPAPDFVPPPPPGG